MTVGCVGGPEWRGCNSTDKKFSSKQAQQGMEAGSLDLEAAAGPTWIENWDSVANRVSGWVVELQN